ncbi:hypothetical protein [Dendrosporobacter quercicolus]|nr:hypothetical protein [Dendrosporobacter quercicolus]
MMSKIGIVGPATSVERILSIIEKSKYTNMEFIPFPYNEIYETADIVKNNYAKVKGWLFSGPAPLMMAKKALGSNDNLSYCPGIGAGIYRSFMQIAYHQKKLVNRISIDMVDGADDVHESLLELGIPNSDMIIKLYDHTVSLDELAQFHLQLIKAGKTDAAITSLDSVYTVLKKENILVYRNTPTTMEIRQAIKIIVEKVTASYFKNTQVGLAILQVENFDEMIEKIKTPYGLQYLELDIKKLLLKFCEDLDGYLVEKGRGRYEIYSSRGSIEKKFTPLKNVINQLSLETDCAISVGIGFAETVFTAELNAHKAVQHAKKRQNGIVIIEDGGQLIENAGDQDELTYSYYSNDKELLSRLNQANISIKTFKKIEAVIRRMDWDSFTSAQIAAKLDVTDRNIRRIFNSLCEIGLLECIGETDSNMRGRPSKIYKLNALSPKTPIS